MNDWITWALFIIGIVTLPSALLRGSHYGRNMKSTAPVREQGRVPVRFSITYLIDDHLYSLISLSWLVMPFLPHASRWEMRRDRNLSISQGGFLPCLAQYIATSACLISFSTESPSAGKNATPILAVT